MRGAVSKSLVDLFGERPRRHIQNRRQPRNAARQRRLSFEPLENRRLLAVLTVNSLLDNTTVGDGQVTLREAITAANTDSTTDLGATGDGPDTIRFAESLFDGMSRTILLSLGELTITDSLAITGPSQTLLTIDANDLTPDQHNGDGSRIFNVDDGNAAGPIVVSIAGLTMTGGDCPDQGGAIRSAETLELTNVAITNNASSASGGGIMSVGGALVLSNCTISGNTSGGSGGGIRVDNAQLTVSDSTISDNQAIANDNRFGGGIAVFSGQATITRSSVTANVGSVGGGIQNSGTLTIIDSAIFGNRSNSSGGAIYNNGPLTLVNTTVSGNIARTAGGISHNAGTLASFNTTIASNIATEYSASASGISASSRVELTNTLVANNVVRLGTYQEFIIIPSDVTGTAFARNTLIGVNTGAAFTDLGGNIIGTSEDPVDPLLGPLVNNGGATPTHALLPGSPAIDAGDLDGLAGVGAYDQRGVPFRRIFSSGPDIGAFELARPTVTAPDLPYTTIEETPVVLEGISIVGLQDTGLEATLNVMHGRVTLGNASSVTIVQGDDNSPAMTIRGTLVDINAAIAHLTYAPDVDFDTTDTLTIDLRHLANPNETPTTTPIAIAVDGVNDPPVISFQGIPSALFTEDDGPVDVVGDALSLHDPDSPVLSSATISLVNHPDGDLESLSVSTAGTYITAASYDSSTGILLLSGVDTLANYQRVLRTLRYYNTSQAPETAAREISIFASDGIATSQPLVAQVTVHAVNDSPTLTLPPPYSGFQHVQVRVNDALTFAAVADDPDNNLSEITFALDLNDSGLPAGVALPTISSTGVFAWTPTQTGSFTITVLAMDPEGAVDSKTFTLDVVSADSSLFGPLEDMTVPHAPTQSLSVRLSPDGVEVGSISYGAEIDGPQGAALPVELSITNDRLIISRLDAFLGTFGVKVTATRHAVTETRTFLVTTTFADPFVQNGVL